MHDFTALVDLSLKHNRLDSMAALTPLTALQVLELDDNGISCIEGLSGCSALSVLRLNDNQISRVGEGLQGCCGQLATLELAGNR